MASLLAIVFTDVVESSATKRDVSLGRDSRERDRAYPDFLTLWKGVDSDIPILKQARAKYARLK